MLNFGNHQTIFVRLTFFFSFSPRILTENEVEQHLTRIAEKE